MQEVLQIIFDLGDQKQVTHLLDQELLKVYQNSDPHKLAQDFVKQHDLKEEALPMIEETIKQHMKISQTKSQPNIFDRLHHEAQIKQQRKQIQFANQQLSSRVIQSPQINYNPGEVLYQKGKQHMEEIERMQEQKKAETSQIDYPFKPFISERSQLIAKRPHKQSMPDYLLQMGKEMNHHKEQMRNSRYQMETQECSFRPNINLVSERILQEKSRESLTNIHERLFQEGMQSKKKRQQLSDSQMNKQRKHSKTDVPFMERMQISVVEQRRRKEQTPQEEEYDQSTGQKLYQPQICRPPLAVQKYLIQRNNDHLPIGEYLYQMRNVKEDKFQCLLEADRQEQLNSRARSLDKSSQIYEIKKRKILSDLFKQLDSDGDGIVSAQRIEISGINSDVLQILAPLLCEMEQINAQLNSQQFIDAANRLIQTLPIVDRDKLMKGLQNKKKLSTDGPSFQPQLNQNSLRMVSTKSMSNHKQHTIEKKNDEMQECTFKPKLYTPLKIYEFMLNQ